MNRPSRDNVQCIRAKTLPVVLTMPSRSNRAEGRGAAMSSHIYHGAHVVTMPSHPNRTQHHSAAVVEMPSRNGDKEEAVDARSVDARLLAASKSQREPHANGLAFSESLRMTLVALFALLGWPPPTRGKDPGAAGARPWKLELLNVISKLRIPQPAVARQWAARGAARASALEFPRPATEDNGADLAQAA